MGTTARRMIDTTMLIHNGSLAPLDEPFTVCLMAPRLLMTAETPRVFATPFHIFTPAPPPPSTTHFADNKMPV
jgi:hypothetical protein